MHACMYVCMYEWMDECMDGWMVGWMDVWMLCMYVWMECMLVMYACMDGWNNIHGVYTHRNLLNLVLPHTWLPSSYFLNFPMRD